MSLPAWFRSLFKRRRFAGELTRINCERQFKAFVYLNGAVTGLCPKHDPEKVRRDFPEKIVRIKGKSRQETGFSFKTLRDIPTGGPILTFASHPGATFANVRIKGPLASHCC